MMYDIRYDEELCCYLLSHPKKVDTVELNTEDHLWFLDMLEDSIGDEALEAEWQLAADKLYREATNEEL
jgi:hypothetical protein